MGFNGKILHDVLVSVVESLEVFQELNVWLLHSALQSPVAALSTQMDVAVLSSFKGGAPLEVGAMLQYKYIHVAADSVDAQLLSVCFRQLCVLSACLHADLPHEKSRLRYSLC